MATLSSFQRIKNDMSLCEQSSDHKVRQENYFVVRIESHDVNTDMSEFAKRDIIAKTILGTSVICAYTYYNVSYILFSSTNGTPHYLDGSHHEICSHYASNATLFTKNHVRCSIIEFESRIKILVYFQMKVFENMKTSILYLSDVTIDKKEVLTLTQNELIAVLEKRASVIWNATPSAKRFGTFYKYYVLPNGGKKLSILSEIIDESNLDKYNSYLFG